MDATPIPHAVSVDRLVRAFLADDHAAVDPRLPELLRVLDGHNAAEDWHKHGTFKDHLLGVYRTLKLWRQPDEVCVLGLFHSVYSNEYVDLALFDAQAGREVLRRLVGAETEELIYLFCVMPRTQFIIDLLDSDGPVEGPMTLKRPDGHEFVLTPERIGAFLVVTLADLAEQWFSWQDEVMAGFPHPGKVPASEHWSAALWPGPLRPSTVSLSLLSRLARRVHGIARPVPPIFADCTALLTEADQSAACALYWQVVMQNGPHISRTQARDCLTAAIAHNPWVAEPHLLLAQLCLIDGDYETAREHAARGLGLLHDWGTPWDKRVAWNGWMAWARLLLQKAEQRTWPATLREHNNLGLVAAAG